MDEGKMYVFSEVQLAGKEHSVQLRAETAR